MPSGSYLALSDGSTISESFTEAVRHYNENSASTYHPRSPEQLTSFFDGLELVEPGVVELSQWRPGPAGAGRRSRHGRHRAQAIRRGPGSLP